MPIDAQLLFSDAQAITATANSTNVIDLAIARDLGPGIDLYANLMTTVAFTATGAGTLTVALVAADDAALTTNATTLWTSAAIPKATLVIGYKLSIDVPRNYTYPLGQRYLGLTYTVATGPMTAGKITAFLDVQPWGDVGVFYPRAAYTVA